MTTPTEFALSDRESRLLALAWQCFDGEPKVDYDKLADISGYTRGSASVTLGKIKRKLKAHAEQESGGPIKAANSSKDGEASKASPKRKQAPAKRKASDDDSEAKDATTPKTAKKTKKGVARKVKKQPTPMPESEDDMEATPETQKSEEAEVDEPTTPVFKSEFDDAISGMVKEEHTDPDAICNGYFEP